MDLQHAELPLDEQDPWLDARNGAQRQVGHPLDRQPRGDLDDEGVVALERGVAPRPGRRRHVGSELTLQIADEQVDPELRARVEATPADVAMLTRSR